MWRMVSPDGVGGRFMVGSYSEGNPTGDYIPCSSAFKVRWVVDSQGPTSSNLHFRRYRRHDGWK